MPLYNWVPPSFAKSKFPAGIILPYLGASTPANWTDFTSANGKQIIGAGGTYSVGASAAASGAAISGTMNSTGAHSGGSAFSTFYLQNSGSTQYLGNSTGGAHTHSFSDTFSAAHEITRSYKLIKSTIGLDLLPPEVAAFAATSLKHPYINTHGTVDRFLEANSTDGILTSASASSVGYSSSSSGAHRHYNVANSYYSVVDVASKHCGSYGAHTHTGTLSGTLNTKYFYLSLWNSATKRLPHQQNMIAMWEGTTAPSGWALCDGAGGRPDLRDYYIRVGSTAQHGTFGGDNLCTWASNTQSSAGGHAHSQAIQGSFQSVGPSTYHYDVRGAHSNHTISATSIVLPAYYALSFIIKL